MSSVCHVAREGFIVFENFATGLARAILSVPRGQLVRQKSFLAIREFSSTAVAGDRLNFIVLLLSFLSTLVLSLLASLTDLLLLGSSSSLLRCLHLHLLLRSSLARLLLHHLLRWLSSGWLALLGEHLVDGNEAEVDLVGTNLPLLWVFSLHVRHQTCLRTELPHAGKALENWGHRVHPTV